MCDTGTALLASQGAGMAMSTVGAFYAGREKQAGLRASADVNEINARMSDRAAKQAIRSGQLRGQQSRLENAAFKSRQKVSLAANGVDLGSETALAALTTTDILGEIDAREIKRGALMESFGYRTQAVNSRNEAAMGRAEASGISPAFGAVPSLLTGAASIAQTNYNFNKFGAYGGGRTVLRTERGAIDWKPR